MGKVRRATNKKTYVGYFIRNNEVWQKEFCFDEEEDDTETRNNQELNFPTVFKHKHKPYYRKNGISKLKITIEEIPVNDNVKVEDLVYSGRICVKCRLKMKCISKGSPSKYVTEEVYRCAKCGAEQGVRTRPPI